MSLCAVLAPDRCNAVFHRVRYRSVFIRSLEQETTLKHHRRSTFRGPSPPNLSLFFCYFPFPSLPFFSFRLRFFSFLSCLVLGGCSSVQATVDRTIQKRVGLHTNPNTLAAYNIARYDRETTPIVQVVSRWRRSKSSTDPPRSAVGVAVCVCCSVGVCC